MIAWPLVLSNGRLVGQDRRRFGDNRACNSDALLLAAAQIARERRGLLSKPDPFQDLARFGLSAPALLAADIERELNIFLGSERGEEVKRLKNESNMLPPDFGEPLRFRALRRMSANEHAALRRRQHASQNR